MVCVDVGNVMIGDSLTGRTGAVEAGPPPVRPCTDNSSAVDRNEGNRSC